MAADLFESYAVTLVAALILGVKAFGEQGLVFPLLIPAVGVLTAAIGIFAVSPRDSDRNGMAAINRGFFVSALVSVVGVVAVSLAYLPGSFAEFDAVGAGIAEVDADPRVIAISAVLIGIVLAAAIQLLTGYFTETNRKPVQDVARASTTGPATNILAGIGLGLESAVYSAILIAAAVFGAYLLGSGSITVALFAVALAGTGLLTTVGVIVSMDTFGPVSDNAQGIAEMSGDMDERSGAILTSLDAVGNTTKAITKGIAIATAVLAATALFGSFTDTVTTALADAGAIPSIDRGIVGGLNIAYPDALVGLIIGASVVFLFSGLAINAVGRAAGRVVHEVRNQFRTKPGIMDGTEKPDYGAVVDICTRDSLRELVTPGTLAVLAPIAVGFGLGYPPLGAFLGGAIAGGVLMAVFLANSGGAWDNAKKLVEDGAYGGKGGEVHAATVIGDTVGDPFKDTAGPSINPLIKVMNLVSLLIAPTVVKYSVGDDENTALRVAISLAAVAVIITVIAWSKRRGSALDAAPAAAPPRRDANADAKVPL
jgi:K(+)-stimulated pyrophosphate-energized sodium pump